MENLKYFLLIFYFCASVIEYGNSMELCSQTFCQCPEAGKEVICNCDNPNQEVIVDSSSLPRQAEALTVSNCGSVEIRGDSFSHCLDLKNLRLEDLKSLTLKSFFYSSEETENADLRNVTFAKIGAIEIENSAFSNFPKTSTASFTKVGLTSVPERGLDVFCDNFGIYDSNIDSLDKGALYSDAGTLTVRNNRIGVIKSGALDASVRTFIFAGNTVDLIEDNGFSIACLKGVLANNVFRNHTGAPFNDYGPDPVCVPDPDTDPYEEDIVYNVVANPSLEFTDNFFEVYSDTVLNFPGANNVPMGSLKIHGNKLKCDCESIKSFVALVDYEHVVPQDHNLTRGAVLFRKEFYDTGFCVNPEDGSVESLKSFARKWMLVETAGEEIRCSEVEIKDEEVSMEL